MKIKNILIELKNYGGSLCDNCDLKLTSGCNSDCLPIDNPFKSTVWKVKNEYIK